MAKSNPISPADIRYKEKHLSPGLEDHCESHLNPDAPHFLMKMSSICPRPISFGLTRNADVTGWAIKNL